jgi:hypothetical protein
MENLRNWMCGSLAICAIGLAGCAAGEQDDSTTATPDTEEVSTVEEAISAGTTVYTWRQGDRKKFMEPRYTSFCYITKISGKFRGAGEKVEIGSSPYGNTEYWTISGSSEQSGVTVHARCSPLDPGASVSAQKSWKQGDPAVQLAPRYNFMDFTNNYCFLTRVMGNFQGTTENVAVYHDDYSWWLGGSSQQNGVAGAARCLNVRHDYNVLEKSIAAPFAGTRTTEEIKYWMGEQSACFIQRIQGNLNGNGENVETSVSDTGMWNYTISTGQNGLMSDIMCLRSY